MKLNQFFESKKEYGAIFLRLVIGFRLVEGMWNIVFNWQQLVGIKDFFAQINLPVPMISAIVAVYAEFICGIFFIIGLWVREVALIMIINFIVAIAVVDIHNSFEEGFAAWVIIAASIFFLFYGAGKISIDEWRRKYRTATNIQDN